MPFVPLFEVAPDLAVQETRSITVLSAGDELPQDTYAFVELFCDEDGCDCRRVMLSVYSEACPHGRGSPWATISFGWENEQFYRDWASHPLSAEDLRDLKGPALAALAPQSEYAQPLLDYAKMLLGDRAYVDRIRRHYAIFRERIEEIGARTTTVMRSEPKAGRNQPCPCGSGRKYKKCCGANAQS